MADDPWSSIALPPASSTSARRAEPSHRFDFFWALSHEGHCMLVMEHESTVRDRRPKLGEIRILESRNADEKSRFILELTSAKNRDVFHQLCTDIINSTRHCNSEKSALATVIRRTWRWHSMLRGARDEKLSAEKQKGLIGELVVLKDFGLATFRPQDALEFWRGPTGAPMDFHFGQLAIEAKAKRGASRQFVRISSADQLDEQALDFLYLAVTYVDEGAPEISGTRSLTQFVGEVSNAIREADPACCEAFNSKLLEAGYDPAHDYSENLWIIGQTRFFHVTGGFPRLVRTGISPAIDRVAYDIDLSSCSEWEVDEVTVHERLRGGST